MNRIHRIRTYPLLAIGLATTLAYAPRFVNAQDDAQAIVAKGIKALGGEEKLAKIKAVRTKGKGTLHVAGGLPYTDETLYQFPDRYKNILNLTTAKQTLTTCWDGADGWLSRDGEMLNLNAKFREEIRNGLHAAHVCLLTPLKSDQYKLTLVEPITVNDRPALGLTVTAKGRSDVTIYFDKETALIAKIRRRALDNAMKEITEERIVKDYHDVDGVKWPKVVQVMHDDKKFMDEETTEVQLNAAVEATAFAKPERKGWPQDPKKPYPYSEEEVTYENQKGKAKFAGTLTRPRGDGPFPAVLLITGSGSQDRDSAIFGHRPFLVLADYLTRRGIAVLRVDDRGVGGSTGKVADVTSADFADDVRAGVAFLKSRKDIDPCRIGLIGHSEGGIIAPMVAADSNDVAFIVLLAGTGVPGEEILYTQSEAILKASGIGEKFIERQRRLQQRLFAAVRESETAGLEKRLREVISDEEAKLNEDEKKSFGGIKSAVESQMPMLRSSWLKYFLMYDPRPTLAKVKCPVLAINGEKDLQVDAKVNLPVIAKALEAGGNKDVTIKELPKLNHLFQTCETGNVAEYGKIEETMAPTALELIGDWIVKRTERKPS